jgi:hypothetical protein
MATIRPLIPQNIELRTTTLSDPDPDLSAYL